MAEKEAQIEVERKYQPTEEQLKSLLEGSDFIGRKDNHDIYYDYPDFRLLKKSIKLRKRNGSFELKIKNISGSHIEIEDKNKIEEYFNLDEDLENFAENNFKIVGEFKTTRDKYKKDGFFIDIDKLDFEYEMCEIEVMIESEGKTKEANKRIKEFARGYNLEEKKILGKLAEYLRLFKPEVYNEIYENKLKEIKMK